MAVSNSVKELIRFPTGVILLISQANCAGQESKTLEDMKTAAQKLHDLGVPAVIIKKVIALVRTKAVDVFMMN